MLQVSKDISSISPEVKKTIVCRLEEFSSFSKRPTEEWFSELCFCLLTANAKAKTAIAVQRDLGFKGFYNMREPELVAKLLEHKHRFHNIKASRIVLARQHKNIKETITNITTMQSQVVARDWLVKNIKGLGLKEASHFLRNTGHENLAIIDRHIVSILKQHNLLDSNFEVKNSKAYLQAEQICEFLAKENNMSLSKLDLSLWYLKTGEVLK